MALQYKIPNVQSVGYRLHDKHNIGRNGLLAYVINFISSLKRIETDAQYLPLWDETLCHYSDITEYWLTGSHFLVIISTDNKQQ